MAGLVGSNNCEMCDEVGLAGASVTLKRAGSPALRFSRLIRRTSVVDVFSGLGCLSPGYLLLVPRRHVNSSGELALEEARHLWDVVWAMAGCVEHWFSRRVVVVEHGSSGDAENLGRACISHAHVHLFLIDGAANQPEIFAALGSCPDSGIDDLRRLAAQGRNYYYCVWEKSSGLLLADPQLESQYARRIWAKATGRPDEWDWAAFPWIENCHITTIRLRDAQPTASINKYPSNVNETIAAYQASAEWYAERTRSFTRNYTLEAEIGELARNSAGVIVDAGAGAGRDAAEFASYGRPVLAIDACEALLRYVPAMPNLATVVADVRSLPLADGSIGCIWCSAVLLHLAHDEFLHALREFYRVLKPGGLVQVSVKEGHGHVSGAMNNLDVRRHFYLYDSDDLCRFAAHAGLSVEKTWKEEENDGFERVEYWVKALLRKNL
jgi:SAM-dependent methyltransferase